MYKVKLNYSPEQLREFNALVKERTFFILEVFQQVRRVSKDIANKERVDLEKYFDDIDTILDKGQFIAFEKGDIIDEMFT